MYERVVGRGEEGTERFKRGNENKKKSDGEKFLEEFLGIAFALSSSLPSPSVRSVKCVAETYLGLESRTVIDDGLVIRVIFYYVWYCRNAFLAYSYILFSLNI
jgi:hypothetical protein